MFAVTLKALEIVFVIIAASVIGGCVAFFVAASVMLILGKIAAGFAGFAVILLAVAGAAVTAY